MRIRFAMFTCRCFFEWMSSAPFHVETTTPGAQDESRRWIVNGIEAPSAGRITSESIELRTRRPPRSRRRLSSSPSAWRAPTSGPGSRPSKTWRSWLCSTSPEEGAIGSTARARWARFLVREQDRRAAFRSERGGMARGEARPIAGKPRRAKALAAADGRQLPTARMIGNARQPTTRSRSEWCRHACRSLTR